MGLKASGSQFLSVRIDIFGKYLGFPVLRLSRIYSTTKKCKKSVIVTPNRTNRDPPPQRSYNFKLYSFIPVPVLN